MFKSSFFKNIAFLSGAGLIAKVAAVLALPVLSRTYEPDAFGLYSIYFSLLMAFPLIASMRLDFAVTISREKNTARLLAVGAFLSLCIFSILTVFILSALIYFDILPFDWRVLPFICLSIFFVGGCDVLRYWGVRSNRHSAYGQSQIVQSVSMVIAQISLFYAGLELSGLVVGDSLSRIAMFAALYMIFGKDIWTNIKWESFFRVIRAYIQKFITYTITNLLHVFPNITLPIFITAVYSKEDNGYFLLSYQMIFSITGVFISSLAQVFLGKIAHLQKNPAYLMRNLNKVVFVLAVIGLPCVFILKLWGPQIYELVFGDGWGRAGEFAAILAPAIYLQLVLSPVLSVFIVLKQPKKQLILDLIWASCTAICLVLAFYHVWDVTKLLSNFAILTMVIFSFFYAQIMVMLVRTKRSLKVSP